MSAQPVLPELPSFFTDPALLLRNFPPVPPDITDKVAAELHADAVVEHLYVPLIKCIHETPETATVVPAPAIFLTGIIVANSETLKLASEQAHQQRAFKVINAQQLARTRAFYYKTFQKTQVSAQDKLLPESQRDVRAIERTEYADRLRQWQGAMPMIGKTLVGHYPALAIALALESRAEKQAGHDDNRLRQLCEDFTIYGALRVIAEIRARSAVGSRSKHEGTV